MIELARAIDLAASLAASADDGSDTLFRALSEIEQAAIVLAREVVVRRAELERRREENKRLRTRLAEHEHYRALGGPRPAITEQWERGTVTEPASASDETAPPLERGR